VLKIKKDIAEKLSYCSSANCMISTLLMQNNLAL